MVKKIKETKANCKACAHASFYGKLDAFTNANNAMGNLGKSMMCCGGCLPAVLIPNKKVVDFNKCPKCGSKAIKKETITHEV